jgi:hypothetical protein
MKSQPPRVTLYALTLQCISLLVATVLLAAPVSAQLPATPARTPAPRETTPRAPEPTFDNLLAVDSYKMYGEVRNIGQLMSTGGVGEIVDPIIKLADPPQQFNSIIKFLKTNAEALATARLLFAAWPARTDVPDTFVAIEFATNDEAAKFAPKLETFLPGVLPPVQITPEASPAEQARAGKANETVKPGTAEAKKEATPAASPEPKVERPAFVLSHTGNLVLISDKSFKFEKLRPVGSKSLFEDQNFRIAHDRFASESVFLFFNVALEEKRKPGTDKQKDATAEAEAERMREAEEDASKPAEAETTPDPSSQPSPIEVQIEQRPGVMTEGRATLRGGPSPIPTPTPTKEQQVQATASAQIGHLLDGLGFGEPQWPEAVGLALALENNDYVIKALLIDAPDAKHLPLPFVPQLIAGPSYAPEAPSVLPDDTEIFVTASFDFLQTYEGMRKATEAKTKAEVKQLPAGGKEPPLDMYAEFEKKSGIKIKDDLLPAFGNEMALAGSLKSLQNFGGLNIGPTSPSKPATESGDAKDDKEKKSNDLFPMLLIAVRDREAARRVMPRILDGLGIGEANLIAQVEKREDTEMVNYAGMFAYAFVGNFVVISEAATVRRVIDANVNHQTLASNNTFRNSRRWEPSRTLGQIYVSPAMMEGYQDQVRKQAATLDPAMRDFLLGLDPTAGAITYSLSNDGLGTQHELHLPKNLILSMVAGISSATKNPPPEMNEGVAMGAMQIISTAESTYKAGVGKGKYGTLDQLVEQKLVNKPFLDKYGYNFEVRVSGDQFEAVATPREYGKTGKRSFFVDNSGVVRGDDHGGAPATAADKPVQQ